MAINIKRTAVSLPINAVSSLMRWLVPSIISFIVIPLLVHKLGGERYGILTMASSMVSLVGFVGVGFNDALIKFLSQALSLDDQDACERLIRSNLFLFVIAFCTITFLVVGLSPWLVESVISPTPELYWATRWVVIISGITFGLSLVAGTFAATLAAAERYDLQAAMTIIFAAVSGVGWIVIALFFPSIVLLSLWGLISAILNLGLMVFMFRRIFPAISIVPCPFRDALKQLSGFSAYRILDAVFALAFYRFDRVLIGMIAGVENLMYYSIPATVSQMLGHGSNSLTMPLIPNVSALQANKKWDEIKALYLRAVRLVAWLALTGVVILVFLADPFLKIWLGETFANRASTVLQWLAAGWGLIALGAVATNIVYGLGRAEVNAALRSVQTLGGLGGIMLFVPTYGLIGAGWGLVIGNAISTLFLLIYVEWSLHMRLGTTLVSGLLQPIVTGFMLSIAARALEPFADDIVSTAMILGALVILSAVLAIVLKVLGVRELAVVKRMLIKILPHKLSGKECTNGDDQ